MITTAVHTKKCLTKMVVQALENARDNEDFSDDDFTAFVTRETNGTNYESTPYSWSMEYYDSWPHMCVCFPERGQGDKEDWPIERTSDEMDKMVRKGFTEDAAYNHIMGMCDMMYCGACNA